MSKEMDPKFLNMLNLLRVKAESVFEIKLDACKDYGFMADSINEKYLEINKKKTNKQGNSIRETTLRNWWGEKGPKNKPYKKTLSIVAESLGYTSWDNFCSEKERIAATSSLFDPLAYKVDEMKKGDKITIGWFPEYFVEFEYLGEYQFKVLGKSSNIKMAIGEEKKIFGFGLHYVENVCQTVEIDEKIQYIGGYPLHPTLTLRNTPEIKNNNENQSVVV